MLVNDTISEENSISDYLEDNIYTIKNSKNYRKSITNV